MMLFTLSKHCLAFNLQYWHISKFLISTSLRNKLCHSTTEVLLWFYKTQQPGLLVVIEKWWSTFSSVFTVDVWNWSTIRLLHFCFNVDFKLLGTLRFSPLQNCNVIHSHPLMKFMVIRKIALFVPVFLAVAKKTHDLSDPLTLALPRSRSCFALTQYHSIFMIVSICSHL